MSKKFTLALLAVALLGGCAQKPAGPAVDPLARLQFHQAFQTALYRSVSANVREVTAGAVSLQIVANRQGQAVSCQAKGYPEGVARLPFDVPRTPPRQFAAMMEQYCRQAIYPTAPDALYDDEGQMELRAPVVVVFTVQNASRWKQRNAQRAFFREHLLKGEAVDSVGYLVVRYQTDGKGCLVDIRPNDIRPMDFKLDGALQGRLNQACMKLDLSGLPGIAQGDPQQTVGQVSLEYAPWTVGR
ncbi:hypothetical protein [Pseudomonas putida]|uniref:Lipoprotein n=1 Tax=Pseudomonas putida TaxID=303 RepID=A0A1Q9QYE5_PSEPU|nr:hypothetical protein [Pseudomonas putida]OLS60153.1 hypothetical protein PSEMO_49640 [Pseudomonas putida]